MKLTQEQTEQVERQTRLAPVPEDNPTTQTLKDHFGDHTFYVDRVGLYVWETVDPEDGQENGQKEPATAILLAAWADEKGTTLKRTEPTPTNVVVDLAPAAAEG